MKLNLKVNTCSIPYICTHRSLCTARHANGPSCAFECSHLVHRYREGRQAALQARTQELLSSELAAAGGAHVTRSRALLRLLVSGVAHRVRRLIRMWSPHVLLCRGHDNKNSAC